jgi:hypothetical protein
VIGIAPSPNIIPIIKTRMKWTGPVSRRGKKRNAFGIWWGNLKGRDHMEDPGVDGRDIKKVA